MVSARREIDSSRSRTKERDRVGLSEIGGVGRVIYSNKIRFPRCILIIQAGQGSEEEATMSDSKKVRK